MYLVEVSKTERFRASHCPVEHHSGLLHLVGRLGHNHPEEVQPAIEIAAVEPRMGVQEDLDEALLEVDLVDDSRFQFESDVWIARPVSSIDSKSTLPHCLQRKLHDSKTITTSWTRRICDYTNA